MSKLEQIQAAAESLAPEEKQQLMLFLATRMRARGVQMPEPRRFSRDQMAGWIAEDEADMRCFQQGK
ncbi:MAG: hypothetical protein ABSC18_03890 [Verrucomicrobiota bacterium]